VAARDYDTRLDGIEISVSDGVSPYCIAAAIVAVNTNLEQLRTGRVPGARSADRHHDERPAHRAGPWQRDHETAEHDERIDVVGALFGGELTISRHESRIGQAWTL